MHLKKIHIENFKSFENITIHFNSTLNIFTGANNSGKTTVLEAIALWNECFNKLINDKVNADPKRGLKRGDFILGSSQPKYVPYTEIVSVRSPSYEDIFHNLKTTQSVRLEVEIEKFENNAPLSITICFVIKPARVFTHIASYKDIFSAIKNNGHGNLWQKSVLIFDKDYLSIDTSAYSPYFMSVPTTKKMDNQKEDLRNALSQKLGIPIHIGSSYTFESSIMTDMLKFKNSLYRYLVDKEKTVTLTQNPNLSDISNWVDV